MNKLIAVMMAVAISAGSAELSTRKILNLATVKALVVAAEAEATKRNVQVTICIVDDSGNLLFLEKQDGAGLNTVVFAQKKARHSAFYRAPSKKAADDLKDGKTSVLAMPESFPNQGGLPIKAEGQMLGGIGVSGAASEVDEAIGQAALDAVFGK